MRVSFSVMPGCAHPTDAPALQSMKLSSTDLSCVEVFEALTGGPEV